MLSTFALRAGRFAPILLRDSTYRLGALSVRGTSDMTKHWDDANKMFFSPERDLKNFPLLANAEKEPPTRLAFIPETFFKLFYEKTGVTGPYMLISGVTAFALSKEYLVVEETFCKFVAFCAAVYMIYAKFGAQIGAYVDGITDRSDEREYHKPMRKIKEHAAANVKDLEHTIWQAEGEKHIFETQRENVDLQLESIYRQRLAEVHQAVKKRLDYQLDIETAQRTIQQDHMVRWIVDNVRKGITPQQEKDSLSKCIQDLKTMASKAAAAPAPH